MIKIQNVTKSFKTYDSHESKIVLKNINLFIEENEAKEKEEGQCIVIAGENGSGKSILMSILAGIEECDEGTVECKNSKGEALRVGLVFQEAETQILGETLREDIAFGPKNLGWKKEKVEKLVQNALEKTGLTQKVDFPARFLSGGEKRRLAIASVLAMECPIIVLDEPYANLDYTSVKQVNEIVRKLKIEGKIVIILTHEIEKCLGLVQRFVVLYKGEKVFDGTTTDAVKQDLEKWNIKNPFVSYDDVKDLVW